MRFEIRNHWEKIKRVSALSDQKLEIAYEKILTRMVFIHEELISPKDWQKAEKLLQDIDEDDIDFVALTRHLRRSLWTGDKVLYEGLKKQNFRYVYNTSDLKILRNKLERIK